MQNNTVTTTGVRLRALQGRRTVSVAGRAREFRDLSKVRSATEEAINSVRAKDQEEAVGKQQHYAGKKALIVGAGPAGSIVSSFLVKQGFQVDVYEQRKDPTKTVVVPTRSIPVVLNRGTVSTIKAANIDPPSSDEEYANGMHRFFGSFRLNRSGEVVPSTTGLTGWLLVERIDFATNVVDIVRREHPERITFHFDHPCVGVDLKKQEVQFQDHNNSIVKRNYDLLIGADGASSQVRKAMEENINDFRLSTTLSTSFYVSCPNIVVNKDEVPDEYKKMIQPGVVTFYRDIPEFGGTEKALNMSFSSLSSGNLSANIFGSESRLKDIKANANEYLNDVLPNDFPQDWIEQMVPQVETNPLCRLPSIIEVSTLVGPHVVLIGDAGHAVTPGLGFGCNMAVQDGLALNEALKSAEGDINLALKMFNDSRWQEISDFQFLEKILSAEVLKHEGIMKLLPLFTAFHLLFHDLGNRHFPWLIPMSALSKCFRQQITSGEAVRTLQIELAALLVLAAGLLRLTIAVIVHLS